jgi:hypothetical protein
MHSDPSAAAIIIVAALGILFWSLNWSRPFNVKEPTFKVSSYGAWKIAFAVIGAIGLLVMTQCGEKHY